jgi:hypothetical protein
MYRRVASWPVDHIAAVQSGPQPVGHPRGIAPPRHGKARRVARATAGERGPAPPAHQLSPLRAGGSVLARRAVRPHTPPPLARHLPGRPHNPAGLAPSSDCGEVLTTQRGAAARAARQRRPRSRSSSCAWREKESR